MSTTFPAPLAAHSALASTTFADLLRITRTDDMVYGFTSSDSSITIDGIVYEAAPGLQIASLSTSAGNAVDNSELTTLDDGSTFTRADVLAGRWHGASYWIGRCNWASPADGTYPVQAGVIGEVRLNNGYIVAEMRALQQYLQQPVGAVTSKTCRARLGDAACGVDVGPFTVAGEITGVTSKQEFQDGVIGGDPLWSGVVTMLHGDGAHGSSTITDSSDLALAVTSDGATISNLASHSGGTSISLVGNRTVYLPTNAELICPGDFTIELWLTGNPVGGCVFRTPANSYIYNNSVFLNGANIISSALTAAAGTRHLALTRSGTTVRIFQDGVLKGSGTHASSVSFSGMWFGSYASNLFLNGYIDEVRITKGSARYTAAFTPTAVAHLGDSTYPPDWFDEGLLTFTSGANAGLSQKVKASSTGGFTLSLPMILPVEVGDTYSVIAGCRKRHAEDCVAKFANGRRFQGEPHVPGLDAMMKPPR